MATPYTDIYRRAMFKVRDRQLAMMSIEDQQMLMREFLQSAVADFQCHCNADLSAIDDESNTAFEADLTNEEKEILALGMSVYWLQARMLKDDFIRNKMSTKDYQYFSPANLVREVTGMRDQYVKEYHHRIINYTYDHGDLDLSEST